MLRSLVSLTCFKVSEVTAKQFGSKNLQFLGLGSIFNDSSRVALVGSGNSSQEQVRWLRSSYRSYKSADDRRSLLATVPPVDEGADGEKSIDLDAALRVQSMFPDENTPKQLFDGVCFSELPICHIKVSKNNTIMLISDHKGAPLVQRSCGMEGFKNAKKGTNIAAQATAITASMKALEMGIKNIRVKIKGLGPGRMASIKGLQMGGMNIVSISDTTTTPECPPRPRKQRKI